MSNTQMMAIMQPGSILSTLHISTILALAAILRDGQGAAECTQLCVEMCKQVSVSGSLCTVDLKSLNTPEFEF